MFPGGTLRSHQSCAGEATRWVDPFDLDVFMPYILANLENQLSRSSVSCCVFFNPLCLRVILPAGDVRITAGY